MKQSVTLADRGRCVLNETNAFPADGGDERRLIAQISNCIHSSHLRFNLRKSASSAGNET
jgi:hypothetical protein